ncbi:MAG: hypothetical protein ACFFFB_17965 [Candidatus Heimdallarchaeota archaeon]
METIHKPPLKRHYVRLFISSLALMIIGFIVTSVANYIPPISFGDPGYEAYSFLMDILSSLAIMFQNIGIVLFSLSSFMGSFVDELLSVQVKRGMLMASVLGIVALVIYNYVFFYLFLP